MAAKNVVTMMNKGKYVAVRVKHFVSWPDNLPGDITFKNDKGEEVKVVPGDPGYDDVCALLIFAMFRDDFRQ